MALSEWIFILMFFFLLVVEENTVWKKKIKYSKTWFALHFCNEVINPCLRTHLQCKSWENISSPESGATRHLGKAWQIHLCLGFGLLRNSGGQRKMCSARRCESTLSQQCAHQGSANAKQKLKWVNTSKIKGENMQFLHLRTRWCSLCWPWYGVSKMSLLHLLEHEVRRAVHPAWNH